MNQREYHTIAITDDASQRREIVSFLANFENEKRGEFFWQDRLEFWWERNPFYTDELPRGWLLVANGQIVGFFGLIAIDYLYNNERYTALNATTWRVLEDYRNVSMSLFFNYYGLRKNFILFNTTPTDTVATILDTFKFSKETKVNKYAFPIRQGWLVNPLQIGTHIKWMCSRKSPSSDNCRIVAVDDTFILVNPPKTELVKDIGPAYVKWFCWSSESFKKALIGYFDGDNRMTSYVIVGKPKKNSVKVIDYFSADSSDEEIFCLLNYVCENPEVLPFKRPQYLLFTDFSSKEILKGENFSRLKAKEGSVRHYYTLPRALRSARMIPSIAQGDHGF
jgi:hypothetical protein